MRVFINPAITAWKGGVAAHDSRLPLAGHGKTEEEAVAELARVVATWCRAVSRRDSLTGALARAGIKWEDGEGYIVVIPAVPSGRLALLALEVE